MNHEKNLIHMSSKEVWKYVYRLLWVNKKLIIWLMISAFILSITDMILPMFNRYAINHYIVEGEKGNIGLFAISFIGLVISQCICVYAFFRFASKLESLFAMQLRKKCFEKIQLQSYAYFDTMANGWIMSRITSDTARLSETLAWAFVDVVWGFMTIIGVTIIMLVVNWKMALAVLIVLPVLFMISRVMNQKTLTAQRAAREKNSQVTAAIAEGINGISTIKTLAMEESKQQEFNELSEKLKRYNYRATKIQSCYQPIVYMCMSIVIASLLMVGGQFVFLKVIQFGTLAMFINYASLIFDPIKQIARVLAEFQLAHASAERIISLLEANIQITDSEEVMQQYGTILDEHKEAYEKIEGNVTFDHVDFSYIEDEMVLNDFNLDVHSQEMIALVGETGSGKSTIVNLLCRFYEPKNGKICIDGIDYKSRSIGWLHDQIGYVLQTPVLFKTSVLENVRYGKPDASIDDVKRVCKMIHCDEFIMQLSDGYDTIVGEGGDLLSTGQKQLISFARALLKDPAIMILDEATSSIDSKSEKLIQEAMRILLHDRTSFVVAHRLSTIEEANRILVMKKGKIVEQGTHAQLMKQKGYYYNLYMAQYIEESEKRWRIEQDE